MRRVVLLSFIWGWSFLLIKVALGGMTPATVAFVRIALGMAVMLVVLRLKGVSLPGDLRSWRHFTVMGLAYSAVPFTLLAWGEQHITSALAAVVNASTGLFTAIAAAIGLGERLRRPQLVGLAVGLLGVAVAAGVTRRDLRSSSGAGILATLAVSACYGFSFVYAQRHLTAVPPLVATAGQLVTGAALALPVAMATTATDGFSPDGREVLAVAALGALGTGFAYVLNYQSIAALGPTKASLVTYLVPVVAVTLGVVLLDEDFRLRLVVGGGLVITGVAMVHGRLRRPPPPRRRPRMPPAGTSALALAAVMLLVACADRGGSAAPDTRGQGDGAACGAPTEEALDPGSLAHILPGAPEPAYSTEPPTSGPHLAGGAPAGAQDSPVSRPAQVALLEQGGVMVQYDGVTPGEVARLESLARAEVVVAPSPGLPAPVVATAWRHRLVCDGVSDGVIRAVEAFVGSRLGQGPEG